MTNYQILSWIAMLFWSKCLSNT